MYLNSLLFLFLGCILFNECVLGVANVEFVGLEIPRSALVFHSDHFKFVC